MDHVAELAIAAQLPQRRHARHCGKGDRQGRKAQHRPEGSEQSGVSGKMRNNLAVLVVEITRHGAPFFARHVGLSIPIFQTSLEPKGNTFLYLHDLLGGLLS
jgi:hypothetical protein